MKPNQLQIAAFNKEAHEKVTAMFKAWLCEGIKYAIPEIQAEIIGLHKHATEGWVTAGRHKHALRDLQIECDSQKREIESMRTMLADLTRPPKEPGLLVECLEFPTRAKTLCRKLHVRSVGDLLVHSENDLKKYRDFGKITLDKMKAELAKHGYALKKESK